MEATEAQGGARPRRSNEVGPTGKEVARRVKEIRGERRLTTDDLAKHVTELGQPMRSTTVTKIERGQRRVDVDDLVALAIALNVSPLALLLPVDTNAEVVTQLTAERFAARGDAWRWGTGARNGLSVSTSKRSSGTIFATSFNSRARGNVTMPASDTWKPMSNARRAMSRSPVKQ